MARERDGRSDRESRGGRGGSGDRRSGGSDRRGGGGRDRGAGRGSRESIGGGRGGARPGGGRDRKGGRGDDGGNGRGRDKRRGHGKVRGSVEQQRKLEEKRQAEEAAASPSIFDTIGSWFDWDEEEEMSEEEVDQLVDDWDLFMDAPPELLEQIAEEEAQKMQLDYAFGGLTMPGGLPGKLAGKALKGAAKLGVEETEVDDDLRDAVQRNLERQYDERTGFGSDVAGVVSSVSGLAGPIGNVVGLAAGGYQASQVPDALKGFNEQMGVDASLPDPSGRGPAGEGGSDRGEPTSVPSSVQRPMMPAANPFATLGMTQEDFDNLLYAPNMSLF